MQRPGRRKTFFFMVPLVLLVAGGAFVSCTSSRTAHSGAYNSERFDLSNWKLTIPAAGEDDKEAAEVKKLEGYESEYFYAAADGAMVFTAPVEGSTTRNSKYPRSELRERIDDKDAKWHLGEGGTMTATLKIDRVPTLKGKPGKIVIGQIHGEDNELVRLYWDKQKIYFKNDRSGDDGKEHKFHLQDAGGATPKIALGEIFSYKIDARGDTLAVSVYAKGKEYASTSPINPVWQSDTLYFKAGIYLGVNAKQGAAGTGQVSFYALDAGHTPGAGLGGLRR